MTMVRIGAVLLLTMLPAPLARAQTFVSYSCADGTSISGAFFKGERNMRIQMDGRALTLPQRLAASGARYAKAGVSFWIKGQDATLKRPKRKTTTCRAL
ncbi:MAG: MliC family protein [Pseudorhodoplanes sp.]|uniref:MliC family protein n=1 Tax=Pseudorhodoplanes sp. TaxID=1934341 RepID=UPI003D12B0C7